jgi:hypothetical protein
MLYVGNGTEDIVRRYSHPSRLFFFSLHLYEKEPTADSNDSSTMSINTEIEDTLPQSDGKYEFYPGTGSKDDYVSCNCNRYFYLSLELSMLLLC